MLTMHTIKAILHYALGLHFGNDCKPQTFQNTRTKLNSSHFIVIFGVI